MNLSISPKLRLAARLLAIIPPLLFLAFAFLVVRQQFRMARPQLVRALTTELSRRLDIDLNLRQVDTSVPGRIVVRGVSLSKSGLGRLATAEEVTIHYSIPRWVRKPERPVAAVTSIAADRAVVYVVRDRNGRVNFVKAFPAKAAGGETFRGQVKVTNSRVYYTDLAAPGPLSGAAVALFHQVEASADFRSGKGAVIELASGRASDPRTRSGAAIAGRLEATGAYRTKGELALSGAVSNLALSFVGSHYMSRRDVGLTSGSASGRFLVTRTSGARRQVTYWLKADGSGVTVRLPGRFGTVTGADGHIEMASDAGMTFSGTGAAAGGRWAAAGAVAPVRAKPGSPPLLQIDARTRSVDYASALRMVPAGILPKGIRAAGSGPVSLQIRGTRADPAVSAELQAPSVYYGSTRFNDVRALIDWSGQAMKFRASATSGGGSAAGEGQLSWRRGLQASTRFRFSEVPLDRVPLPRIRGTVSGLASGDGEVALRGGQASGAVRFQVRRPVLLGRSASSVRGRIGFDARRMIVQSLLVSTREGFITASGPVGMNGTLNLRVSAAGIELSRLLAGTYDASGTLDAAGTLTGSMSDPVFRGQAQLLQAEIQGEQIDFAAGEVVASRRLFRSDDMLVTRGLAEVRLSGDIISPLSPGRRLDMDASVRSLDIADLRPYAPALEKISARVSGTLTDISGTLRDISAGFDLSFDGLKYGTIAVPDVQAKGSYDSGVLNLASLEASRGNASLSGSGQIGPRGKLDLTIARAEAPVSDLLLIFLNYVSPVEGVVTASGTVSGTTDDPTAEIKVGASSLSLSGQPIEVDPLTVAYSGGKVTIDDASVRLAGGQVALSSLVASFGDEPRLQHASIGLGAPGAGLDLPTLASIVRSSGMSARVKDDRVKRLLLAAPERVTGNLSGSVTLNDEGQGLVATAEIAVANASAWGIEADSVAASGSYGPEGYRLASLRAEKGEAVVSGSASLLADNSISADIEGNNIPLSAIPHPPELPSGGSTSASATGASRAPSGASLAPSDAPENDVGFSLISQLQRLATSGGTASFSFTAGGTVTDPEVQGSILIANATLGGVKIEQIDTGLIRMDKDSADVSEAIIASGNHRIRLSGTIPFSINQMRLVDGSPIDLQATLLEQDLDILGLFSKRVDAERTEGEVRASISAAGTWPSFEVDGLIEVSGGTIGLTGMNTTLRDVNVRVDLAGDRADIERFSIRSSDGGELSMTGGARLTPDGWTLDAAASAQGFGLNLRNLSGVYDESYNGKVDAELTVQGPTAKPLVQGQIVLRNGSLGLPAVTEAAAAESKYPIDPSFNVRLEAGRDLRVRNPRLNVGVRGGVQLARSLSHPSVTGQLEVTEGYLLFPGSRFRVVPVGLIEFAYEPPESTQVTLDIRAQTNLAGSSIASGLVRTGPSYRVEMHIKGPLADPQVTFQSNPPGLTSSGIVSLLGQQAGISPGGFGAEANFRNEVTNIFTASVAPGLLEPIELALAEAFGLQELSFGFGADEPASIQFTRRLFDGVSVTYWRSIAGDDDLDEWRLSYDITDWIRLSYGETRYRTTFVGFEGTFRF